MTPSNLLRVVRGLCCLPLFGCSFSDIDQWKTAGAERYCGAIVTLPDVYTPVEHDGFSPHLKMSLTFDPDGGESGTLGLLSTNDADGPCAPSATFDSAPLRLVGQLERDPLSTLQFGMGREYNYITWVTSTCRGSMVAVVSLMSDGNAEVRLLKDISQTPTAPAPTAGFALFPMLRQSSGCEFGQ